MNLLEITLFVDSEGCVENALAVQPAGLRRLRPAWTEAPRVAHPVLDLFGLPPDTALAPLRYLGDVGAPANDLCACADPIHLVVRGDGLVIAPLQLELTAEDRAGYGAVLAELVDAGSVPACVGNRGYITGDVLAGAEFTPLTLARNRDVQPALPAGATGPHWRRRMTEAQMLLHAAPFNAARAARGAPAVNGVWFWGAGRLPATIEPAITHVWSHAPLPCGLARHAGIALAPAPDDNASAISAWLRQLAPGKHLWAPRSHAAQAYIEETMARLIEALAREEMARLTIVSDDRRLTLAPRDVQSHWQRVWRRLWRRRPGSRNPSATADTTLPP